MKKCFIAVVLTLGMIGTASAACEAPIYNAPAELQPPCVKQEIEATDAPRTVQGEEQKEAGLSNAKQKDVTPEERGASVKQTSRK